MKKRPQRISFYGHRLFILKGTFHANTRVYDS